MEKITHEVEGKEVAWVLPDQYFHQEAGSTSRLVIGARRPVKLLKGLVPDIGPELFLLYILAFPRGEGEPGRYESPELDPQSVRAFLGDFEELLEKDARHQTWIGSTKNRGMLVLDRHGLIYAYGPLEVFERRLSALGFQEEEFKFAVPHSHYYHSEMDSEAKRILGAIDWHRTELREGDED